MMVGYQIFVTLLLAAFLGLVIRNLGDYRRPAQSMPNSRPFVSICLPARNEAVNIEACVRSLLLQDYDHFEIIVLDDCSEDATAEIVCGLREADPRVRLIPGASISLGWAGKCHACAQLAQAAGGEYLLFMDADTRAEPGLLGAALAVAEETGAGLVSAFPRQVVGSFWEQIVLPMLQFLIVTLIPVHQIWESKNPAFSAACGQFLLFRRETYQSIGGHAAIRGSFHDGLALARAVKTAGGTVRLFDGSHLLRCRMYEGGQAVWNGFTRNAYEGLGSFGALLVMTGVLGGLFLSPFVFLGAGMALGAPWTLLCAAQVGILLLIRSLQAARFGHWESVPLFPLSLAAVIAIQWGSFLRASRGAGVTWKGRTYNGLPKSPLTSSD